MHSQLLREHLTSATTAVLDRRPRPLAGINPRSIPKILAAWLEGNEETATGLLEYLSGQKLRLQVIRSGKRPLTDREQFRLEADGLVRCNWRHAVLRIDDGTEDSLIAAAVSLAWAPARLPWATCSALDAGEEPAGVILGRLPGGVRRVDRLALPAFTLEELTGQTASVTATAVLEVDGHGKVAIAEEFITERFTASLALSFAGAPASHRGGR